MIWVCRQQSERVPDRSGDYGEETVTDELQEQLSALQEEVAAQRQAFKKQKPRKARTKEQRPIPTPTPINYNTPDPDAAAAANDDMPSASSPPIPGGGVVVVAAPHSARNSLSSLFPRGDNVAVDTTAEGVHAYENDPKVAALFASRPFHRKPVVAHTAVVHTALETVEAGMESRQGVAGVSSVPDVPTVTASALSKRLRGVFQGSGGVGQGAAAAEFVRSEDTAILEAQLKADRPELMADFRRKQKTVLKKAKALKKRSRA